MAVDRRLVAVAIGARLATVRNAVGYYGQIGRPLPGVDPATIPADPPPKGAHDLRVQPYFIFYPGSGGPGPDATVAGCEQDATIPFAVTAAGGDSDDVLALLNRLHAALHHWTPAVPGHVFGWITHPVGYVAGPLLTDNTVSPARHYVRVPYQVTVTT